MGSRFGAVAWWTASLGALAWSGVAAADIPAEPRRTRRVEVTVEVTGELYGLASRTTEGTRQPISMEAMFEFVETLEPPGMEIVATRLYGRAQATLDTDEGPRGLTLPEDARQISMARLGTTPQPFLAAAHLSRDELELLETPFDSLLLEDMLPGRPVGLDDRWQVAGDLAAGLLAIDTVEAGTVEARVARIDAGMARIVIEGVVDGAVDGVPTHVVIDGEFTVGAEPDEDGHVLVGDVTSLDVVVKERRQASHVAAGFEIEARLAVSRSPADGPAADAGRYEPSAEAVGGLPRRRGAGRPGLVWYRDPEGLYDLVHDAGWRCVGEDAGGLVLRLVDLGALVAQCSITASPRSDDAVPPAIDEVKRHVEQSLSGQFARFDGARETVREEDGVRLVRVVSEGNAEGLPFRWVHYVITDSAGHRVNVTFMYEASFERRFAAADEELVAGLRFAAEPHREARLPPKTQVP